MKLILSFILAILVLSSCKTQIKLNSNLKSELDEILRLDQSFRMLFDNNISLAKKDSLLQSLNIEKEDFQKKSWGLVLEQDSINMKKVELIIAEYGYPGKSLVGEGTNKSAWYVIQHSNKIAKYLPIIKDAANKKEIPFKNYAMMLDRSLVDNKEEQIYGTQGYGSFYLNSEGKEEFIDFIWPVKNPEKVNELRKKVGFNQTIEDYAKELYGENYIFKNLTLSEAIKIASYKKVWD